MIDIPSDNDKLLFNRACGYLYKQFRHDTPLSVTTRNKALAERTMRDWQHISPIDETTKERSRIAKSICLTLWKRKVKVLDSEQLESLWKYIPEKTRTEILNS